MLKIGGHGSSGYASGGRPWRVLNLERDEIRKWTESKRGESFINIRVLFALFHSHQTGCKQKNIAAASWRAPTRSQPIRRGLGKKMRQGAGDDDSQRAFLFRWEKVWSVLFLCNQRIILRSIKFFIPYQYSEHLLINHRTFVGGTAAGIIASAAVECKRSSHARTLGRRRNNDNEVIEKKTGKKDNRLDFFQCCETRVPTKDGLV